MGASPTQSPKMNVMPALPPAVLSSWANPTICTVVWVPSASATDFTWVPSSLPSGVHRLYFFATSMAAASSPAAPISAEIRESSSHV